MKRGILIALSLFVALGVAVVIAQSPTAPAPLTPDEKITLLRAENEALLAQQALQRTPEFARAQKASQDLTAAVQQAFLSRKITEADWALCDGPAQGACASVAQGEMTWKPQPKPEPKVKTGAFPPAGTAPAKKEN